MQWIRIVSHSAALKFKIASNELGTTYSPHKRRILVDSIQEFGLPRLIMQGYFPNLPTVVDAFVSRDGWLSSRLMQRFESTRRNGWTHRLMQWLPLFISSKHS